MSTQQDFEAARTARYNARQQSSRYHVENEVSPSGLGNSPQVMRSRSRQDYGANRSRGTYA
ncbi:MAG: hypothetical protein PUA57_02310, partial [Eggerthellales bacterium]|nr:hypothetical protein [Eggerthellales bacterium]